MFAESLILAESRNPTPHPPQRNIVWPRTSSHRKPGPDIQIGHEGAEATEEAFAVTFAALIPLVTVGATNQYC